MVERRLILNRVLYKLAPRPSAKSATAGFAKSCVCCERAQELSDRVGLASTDHCQHLKKP